jgi:hypothetical protein
MHGLSSQGAGRHPGQHSGLRCVRVGSVWGGHTLFELLDRASPVWLGVGVGVGVGVTLGVALEVTLTLGVTITLGVTLSLTITRLRRFREAIGRTLRLGLGLGLGLGFS